MNEQVDHVKEVLARARQEIGKVIIGQGEVIDRCLIAVFAGQHVLIEGVPGVAKTLLVRTFARVLAGEFGRIQFTPDLMPSDITGTNVFNMKDSTFALVKGPVFTSFLLADEINRAPAKTQSALLQAMQERQVSIDGVNHSLPENFTVFATQNPIEYEGTYPLPEAQKDRFMLKLNMGYPEKEEELSLAGRLLGGDAPERVLESDVVEPVLSVDQLPALREALSGITLKEDLIGYVVDLVRASREEDSLLVGAGPRATAALLLASRVFAALQGRDFVSPDDIRSMVYPVLVHRLVLRPEYEIEGATVEESVTKLLERVAVPR